MTSLNLGLAGGGGLRHKDGVMTTPLGLEDQRHLNAAEGWLGLGDYVEADKEIEGIAAETRSHPAVLEVRWQIHAKARRWEGALEIASALAQGLPEEPIGWIHRSYSLHELKRTQEARDNLLRVVDQFPHNAIMRYNLACYECQLGRLEQAKTWLEKAYHLGEPEKIKLMALEDPDLEPLWREILGRTGLSDPMS